MGKERSKNPWPEERTSSRWMVSLDEGTPRADESSKDPEALLSAAEDGPAVEAPEAPRLEWEDVGRYLHRLPAFEADIVRLRLDGLSQQQIATVFGVVQQTVSYRLRRAMQRIRWLSTVPELTEEGFARDLSGVLTAQEVEVLRTLWSVGSQSRTAEALTARRRSRRHHGVVGQGTVRLRALRALRKLREAARLCQAVPDAQGPGDPQGAQGRGRPEVLPYLAYFEDMFSNGRWGLAAEMRNAADERIRAAAVIPMDDE